MLKHASQVAKPIDDGDRKARIEAQKELVEALKVQWKLLWTERFDDKVRAEGVSMSDYSVLQVERGAVIHATKDFKALSLKEIIKQNITENPDRFISPDSCEGGWNKFVKMKINARVPQRNKPSECYVPDKKTAQQPKKGGRGWLHAV